MLNTDERTELQRRVRGRKSRAEDARRARVILMLAAGESFTAITATLGCYPDYINRWKRRFEAARLAGLRARCCGQPPTVRGTPPRDGSAHLGEDAATPARWQYALEHAEVGQVFGISHVLVARVWRRAGLQPHRLERYVRSDDPHFEEKAADVLGLYLNPPQHAIVFAADESSTRSNCGLGRSNATSWLAVSSRRSPTSPARFGATSRATTKDPKPIRWTYSTPAHRITTHSADTGH